MTDTPIPDTDQTDPAAFKRVRTGTSRLQRAAPKRADTTETPTEPAAPAKAPSKLDRIAALLARPEGASLEDLCAATGWQAHSVRGAMAGALKRKGLVITSDGQDGVRRYRSGTGS